MDTAQSSPIITNAKESGAPGSIGNPRQTRPSDWGLNAAIQTTENLNTNSGNEPQHTHPRVSKRKRLTVYLPVHLLERLRNTVYWTRGTTVAGLLEAALIESLDQKEHQRGGPFPTRLGELKGGRPKRRRSDSVQG
ncbi:MAG: hypothetical protein ACREJU_15750 [Nitrospiraceae bacterium]